MKNTTFIRYDKASGRESLLNSDSLADFYVLFAGKLYFLRKQFLSPSSYFTRKIQKKHRVHVINCNFKSSAFQKILSCFYGLKCIFESGNEADELMEVIKFLQCRDLQELLRSEIIKNFREYDIFFLLDFSNKYHDNQLQVLCQQELVKQNFQQLNFNRFELLKCREQVFKNIIKLHQKLKTNRVITGLAFQDIRKLILQYNLTNSTSVDILNILVPPPSSIIVQDPQGQKDSPLPEPIKKIKKYNTTKFNSSHSTELQQNLISISGCLHESFETCLSQRCQMEKNIIQKTDSVKGSNQQQIGIEDIKAILIRSDKQTEPQESYENSERTTVHATSDTLKLQPQMSIVLHTPITNMFSKKKRSGSTSIATNMSLINSFQFQNEEKNRQAKYSEPVERLIKSQTVGNKKCQHQTN